MGKGGGGSAPAAPDPIKTSQAQADAYIKAAKQSSILNNLAQFTPYGNITFDKDEEGVPIAQRVSLSPAQQAAFDAQTQLQGTLSNAAAQLAGSVPTGPFGLPTNLPGYTTGLDLEGAPDYMRGLNLSNVPNAPGTGDFSADRNTYEQAMFNRGMSRAAGWTVLPILRRGVRFGEDTLELQERRNKSWCDLMDVVRQSGIPIILCSAGTDYGIGDQPGWLLSRPEEAESYLQWIARYPDVLEVLR